MPKSIDVILDRLTAIADEAFDEMVKAEQNGDTDAALELKGRVAGLITARNVVKNATRA